MHENDTGIVRSPETVECIDGANEEHGGHGSRRVRASVRRSRTNVPRDPASGDGPRSNGEDWSALIIERPNMQMTGSAMCGRAPVLTTQREKKSDGRSGAV